MTLFDVFKKKKITKEKKKEIKKPVREPAKEFVKKAPKEKAKEIKEEKKAPVKRKVVTTTAYKILKGPHITEKATELTEENQYVFKIWQKANKTEIKKAIEGLYGVDVLGVRIINVLPKKRRLGKTRGWKEGYKKAIVKIKKGQKIEILPR